MAHMLSWIRLPDLPFMTPPGPAHDNSSLQPRPRFPPWKLPHAGLPAALPLLSLPLPLPRNALTTSSSSARPPEEDGSLCVEVSGSGLRRVYRPRGTATQGFQMEEERQTHSGRLRALAQSYLLPQGFPDSVAPQYSSYMFWRGVQYLFGGAMSVFTTTSLMGALGVAGRYGGEASAAINWVIKDGAGRLGRLLFARWGRELDCELKQFRLFGDLLMEGGAAMELATIFAPGAFLPLACTANLAKNLAAVAASSTRAPIYRTFALSNNLADVTAKGESVANLADIIGTVMGIGLSKARLPLVPTFCALSVGYLLASRREVDSVQLPYLNRARMAVAMQSYLSTGDLPGIAAANASEWLLPFGGFHQGRLDLGAAVDQAAASPSQLHAAAELYRAEKYILMFRRDTNKAYVILRSGAQTADYVKAAFSAHVLLYLADSGSSGTANAPWLERVVQGEAPSPKAEGRRPQSLPGQRGGKRRPLPSSPPALPLAPSAAAADSHVLGDPAGEAALQARCRAVVEASFPTFLQRAEGLGWRLELTMLNPKETRLMSITPLLVA